MRRRTRYEASPWHSWWAERHHLRLGRVHWGSSHGCGGRACDDPHHRRLAVRLRRPRAADAGGVQRGAGWTPLFQPRRDGRVVEWAHATAPEANILLVTSPTAETLGVQGLPQFMNAEQDVVDNHLADVISQSFASAEGAFSNFSSLDNLRKAFISAAANHVTMLGSSGDGGTANPVKEPVKEPALIPYPSVQWPASDPLVTGVGGTNLCTNAVTGTSIDSTRRRGPARPIPACVRSPGSVAVVATASSSRGPRSRTRCRRGARSSARRSERRGPTPT